MTSTGPHPSTDPMPLYVLAGGRSSRFGTDKARALLAGEPLIVRVAGGLWPSASAVTVIADRVGRYADLGLSTVADTHPGHGPLAGLQRSLTHRLESAGPGWIVMSSCDLLEPHPQWIQPLADARAACTAVAYADTDGRWQPLPGVYHTGILPAVTEALASPYRSLWRVLASINATPVPLPPGFDRVPQANTPEQLAAARPR